MIQWLREQRSSPLGPVALFATLVTAGGMLLFRFPPERYSFYPRCPVAVYLHLQCPGCGTTRAIAAILHGHFYEALRLNPLTTLLLPIVVFSIVRHLWRERRSVGWTLPQPSSYAIYALLVFAAIFSVVRNLP